MVSSDVRDRALTLPASPGEVRPREHACHIYEDPEEQAVVAADYLRGAIGRGERGLLLAPASRREACLAALGARGVDPAAALARGALRVFEHREVYLADGRFVPARQTAFWRDQLTAALDEGFNGVAALAEMSWALAGAPGVDALVEYEADLGLRFDHAFSAICQYDRHRFTPEILCAMVRTHAVVLHAGRVLRNPYALPPGAVLSPEPAGRELERLLAAMHERELTEDALRQSERFHRLLHEHAQDVLFRYRLDPPGLEYISPASIGLSGYSPAEYYADPGLYERIIHPDDLPLTKVPVEERARSLVRSRILRKDGTVLWTEERSALVRDEHGQPVALEGVVRDITERVRSEEVLRGAAEAIAQREAQLRLAFESAEHAFWELDVGAGRFVSGEPWAMFGYAPGEVPPTFAGWGGLVHPDDAGAARAGMVAHIAGGDAPYRADYRIKTRDGAWRWVQVRGRAIARDGEGRATRVAGTITDVTETKRLENQLRQADRLASVGTLAAGVAHEVNNPLAYLATNLSFVDEALGRLAAGEPGSPIAELREALREAMDGAARVKGIVQGLRQFATPPRSGARGRIDPRPEIEAALGLARNTITHRARLRAELAPALPAIVAAEHELSQVLLNLLVNAAQALPEGDAGLHEVAVTAAPAGGRLVLQVKDTGAGIAAADLPRIFDPFFTTKPVGSGTGLGLSICHGIVSALGGTIEVESAPGQGTTFRVLVPLAPAEQPAEGPAPAPRARVLVVDDEPLVARSLARLLGGAHEVITLTSPAEVLVRARAGERWDVVLCDLMMPEMSGMDLEAALVSARPDLVPRIVYLTGGAFTERSRSFLAAGRPYLEKPVDPAVLRACVDGVIRGGRAGGAAA